MSLYFENNKFFIKFINGIILIINNNSQFSYEIGKNLIFNGIKKLYFISKDLNIIKKLDELNSGCIIKNIKSIHDIKFDVVILLNESINKIIKIEKELDDNTRLICGCTTNFNGFIFVNAKEFISYNPLGEIPEENQIKIITNDGFVHCQSKIKLKTNDIIKFLNLDGNNIDFLNKEWSITTKSSYVFQLNDFPKKEFIFRNGSIIKIIQTNKIKHNNFSNIIIKNSVIDLYKNENIFKNNSEPLMISIFGSIISNEIIKLICNILTPLNQFFIFNEKINKNLFFEKIKDKNINIIGCGLLSYEILKNLSLMNIITKNPILISDHKKIKKNDLNNIIFKKRHTGKLKSKIMKKEFNNINIKSFNIEIINTNIDFSTKFLKNSDFIFDSVSKIETKKYIDSIAFKYNIPFISNNIQRNIITIQPIIPFITDTYNNTIMEYSKISYPICVIKNFPNMIQHTIQWACEKCELFDRGPKNLNNLEGFEKVIVIKDINIFGKLKSWKDCAKYCYQDWYDNFKNNIIQLLYNFPKNKLHKDGSYFWSQGKRCPEPLNEINIEYILSMTKLLSNCCNFNYKKEDLIKYIKSLSIQDFKINKNKKIAEKDEDIINEIETLEKDLVFIDKYYPQKLKKSIKYINIASNCRALNYGITPCKLNKTKNIIFNIKPSIINISLTAAFMILEMIKYFTDDNNFKIRTFNFATNKMITKNPDKALIMKIGSMQVNYWDKFNQTKDIKLTDFISLWSKKFGTEISMVLIGSLLLYCDFMPCDLLNKKLSDIIWDKMKFNVKKNLIEIIISSDDIEDLPNINFQIME